MIHLGSLICYSCQMNFGRNLFDENERRPVFGTCGHTVCLSCIRINPNGSCPICKKTGAFISEKSGLLQQTANYDVMKQMEVYKTEAFQTFRTWWDTLISGMGACSNCDTKNTTIRNCLTCQKRKNLEDIILVTDVLCESCADLQIAEGAMRHRCNQTPVIDRMRDYQQINCTKCKAETLNPQICTECFHDEHNHVNIDTFAICANCVLDHHGGHEIQRALDNDEVRQKTFDIIHELMKAKMNSLPETKCILRKLRLDLTWKDLNERAGWCYDKNDKRTHLTGLLVEETLDSLERQFNNIMRLQEDCHCVKVWEDVERLKIHDWNGQPPHFMAMCPEHLEDIEGCPYDWESNQGLRQELEEIIEKGEVLTEPLDTIYVLDGDWCRISNPL